MGLLGLPSELIAQVFIYLDDQDVFAARSSNKVLDKASFAHFGKRFFRKKGFMITSLSLAVLQNIADHEELRKYVQHVWFNPDCYTFARPECAPDDEDQDLDEADELMTPMEKRYSETTDQMNRLLAKQYDAYRECMRDHNELMYTPQLEQKLTSVFPLLPSLETIGMRRSEDYGPYGWTVLRGTIGEDPRVLGPIPTGPAFELSGPTSLFIAIIQATAKTGVKLRRLYTDAVEIDNIRARVLPPSLLHDACNSLWYVELNATKGWLIKHDNDDFPAEGNFTPLKHSENYGAGLVRFFAAMPNLKEIGLQIFPDRRQSHLVAPTAQNPDSWRHSYPYLTLHKLANEVNFPHLNRVKLEKVTATSAILRQFLEPCSLHLTSLKLRDIRLLSSEEEPRPWETFFNFLSTHCPELEYLIFYHLLYDKGGISFVQDPAPAVPAETQDHVLAHLPQSNGRNALFAKYEDITFEASGKEDVRESLGEMVEKHWYHKPLFSYAMDEELWHTDTSDEEW